MEHRENKTIIFRITDQKKQEWKKICETRKISLTSLIVNSVESRIMDDERRKVLEFIEKQDNVFVKIETNINQIAKIVNTQKLISSENLKGFNERLSEIIILKKEQNKIFENIYSLISK
jgi:cation transport regulator ChaC